MSVDKICGKALNRILSTRVEPIEVLKMKYENYRGLMKGFKATISRGIRSLTSPGYVRVYNSSREARDEKGFDYYPEMVANDYY